MKFTAYVQTDKNGSQCETEFEVDDEALEGMSEDDRIEYLQNEAVDAVWDAGLVSVYCEESGE